jgi:hypothetical protein
MQTPFEHIWHAAQVDGYSQIPFVGLHVPVPVSHGPGVLHTFAAPCSHSFVVGLQTVALHQ